MRMNKFIIALAISSFACGVANAKESMFAFFAKKIGSSIVKIGENYAKNKISPPKHKKKESVIIESNIIPEGAKE